jgi:N-acetylmuramic acid 6-phosphate etherase
MDDRPTEARHSQSDGLHSLPATLALSRLLAAQVEAVSAIQPALPSLDAAAGLALAALRSGGRMGYAGAGSSGLMALADCLELAGTFGIPPSRTPMMFAGGASALLHMAGGVEDDPALAEADLAHAGIAAGDVVIGVSASGSTPYTLAIAAGARRLGAKVIAIANVPGSPLLQAADVPVLLDTGPELVAGSTRMGAATAQKVALNMISVLVGIGLGHVHDGYMVNVVADNAKLRHRAAVIVAAIAGVDAAAASLALQMTEGAVKPAVLVAQGATPDSARAALARSNGLLGPAMAERHI